LFILRPVGFHRSCKPELAATNKPQRNIKVSPGSRPGLKIRMTDNSQPIFCRQNLQMANSIIQCRKEADDATVVLV
jgi:hypothetical protein